MSHASHITCIATVWQTPSEKQIILCHVTLGTSITLVTQLSDPRPVAVLSLSSPCGHRCISASTVLMSRTHQEQIGWIYYLLASASERCLVRVSLSKMPSFAIFKCQGHTTAGIHLLCSQKALGWCPTSVNWIYYSRMPLFTILCHVTLGTSVTLVTQLSDPRPVAVSSLDSGKLIFVRTVFS